VQPGVGVQRLGNPCGPFLVHVADAAGRADGLENDGIRVVGIVRFPVIAVRGSFIGKGAFVFVEVERFQAWPRVTPAALAA
jgi:hypothetical protein